MGFINDNTNTFKICLTDKGKEMFLNGGLKDAVVFFSLSDKDSNYDILEDGYFDPTDIEQQPMATINHLGTRRTSLVGTEFFSDNVFTQTSLRGGKNFDIEYRNGLFGCKKNVGESYIFYSPELTTADTLRVITYIKRNDD